MRELPEIPYHSWVVPSTYEIMIYGILYDARLDYLYEG